MKGQLRIALVTGLSGSGKSTAINALEDLGYYCIDNLPPALIARFAELSEGSEEISKIALGVDSRGREFLEELPPALDALEAGGHRAEVLYLEAGDDVLVRRFSETRRRHPLAEGSDVKSGIRRERELLAPLRGRAGRVLDTSALTGHELRGVVREIYGDQEVAGSLQLNLLSFGFKYGVPADADIVWDVRFLPNPFYVPDLREKTGLDQDVYDFVMASEGASQFSSLAWQYLEFTLPLYEREGKSYLTVAIGCTGGHHRSVTLVEKLGKMLKAEEIAAVVRHRDVQR